MHAIEIAHLCKRYGAITAVDDLSLSVPRGCLFGFLGPNGSGKTTTIGCLTGVLDPTAGDVRLLGMPMNADAAALKRRIGVMPETLGLFDALYAHEFLAFQGRVFGLSESDVRQRTTELLEAMQLSNEGNKPLAEFSAGMRKRVAFAAAIVHAPDVVFLDEPFESIDPAGVALMKQWLRMITARGGTVFMTSHVLETVERLCDRVAIIKSPGALVWQGDISPLAADGVIVADSREFRSLEELFLRVSGERYAAPAPLRWI